MIASELGFELPILYIFAFKAYVNCADIEKLFSSKTVFIPLFLRSL